jgi:hypothetical protein
MRGVGKSRREYECSKENRPPDPDFHESYYRAKLLAAMQKEPILWKIPERSRS